MEQLRERINFLKTFVFDKNVGAIMVSSRFVVQEIVKHLPKNVRTIIECGPGEGVVTRALLKRLSPEGKLIVIEANKVFASLLQKNIHDARLKIAQGNAQDMITHADTHGIGAVDVVVASIPFSFLTPSDRLRIVRDAHKLLRSGGRLIIFNYSPLMYRPMKQIFGNAHISFELRNIPPCFIMIAEK